MAKRHQTRAGDWESIVGRLQELVLANSGEDEFREIFKILVAKLYSEKFAGRAPEFQAQASPTKTAYLINDLLARASSRWPGIIDDDARSRLTDDHLSICAEAIAGHSLCDTNLEVLDGFFEFLVSRAIKGSKGQFFTPRQVVECCVKIMNPSPSEVVLDPACGSGGFLMHVLNHNADRLLESRQDYCSKNLWGCDFDKRAIQIAKALMLVASDGSANLHQLNSLAKAASRDLLGFADDSTPRLTIEDLLRTKARKFRGFDVILTNPPFAGEIREQSVLETYQVAKRNRRTERDALFLERCVELLRPGGRLGIVLPHNKFGSASWSYLREWLAQNLKIVVVLGLDRRAFLPHTHQKTSVLFGIKREKPVRQPDREPILFVLSESSGKDSAGRIQPRRGTRPEESAWLRADHDFESVLDQVRSFTRAHEVGWSV
ncbi:MAG: N-6 DNA methylase [Gammaproteobacteria bacterium]|nr:N-6 DNA methylase [Gammaproteobacteria bacterium]